MQTVKVSKVKAIIEVLIYQSSNLKLSYDAQIYSKI